MIETKSKPTPEIRKKIVDEMLSFHNPTFMILKESRPNFYPKSTFRWKEGTYISLYERELTSNTFYTELVNDFYEPLEPEKRTLYRWKGNSSHVEEYYKTETNGGGYRYFVPVDELEEINVTTVALHAGTTVRESQPVVDVDEPDEKDSPISKMTIRDRCAIEWKIPVSEKKWLNDLIRQQFPPKKSR